MCPVRSFVLENKQTYLFKLNQFMKRESFFLCDMFWAINQVLNFLFSYSKPPKHQKIFTTNMKIPSRNNKFYNYLNLIVKKIHEQHPKLNYSPA